MGRRLRQRLRHRHQSDLRSVVQRAMHRSALYKANLDRHSLVVHCPQRGRNRLDDSHLEILGDFKAINRPDSRAFEITGRLMMHRVTSCITRRSPRTSGAFLVDLGLAQPIAEWSPTFTKTGMTNLSPQVIEACCNSPPVWRRSAARQSVPTECASRHTFSSL